MIYTKRVETTDERFQGRVIHLCTPSAADGHAIEVAAIEIPDEEVICNGCNGNVHPGVGFLVYLGKRELKADTPYDFYCGSCVTKYFPKAEEVT